MIDKQKQKNYQKRGGGGGEICLVEGKSSKFLSEEWD